jgi:S1-C subfamily serine protease
MMNFSPLTANQQPAYEAVVEGDHIRDVDPIVVIQEITPDVTREKPPRALPGVISVVLLVLLLLTPLFGHQSEGGVEIRHLKNGVSCWLTPVEQRANSYVCVPYYPQPLHDNPLPQPPQSFGQRVDTLIGDLWEGFLGVADYYSEMVNVLSLYRRSASVGLSSLAELWNIIIGIAIDSVYAMLLVAAYLASLARNALHAVLAFIELESERVLGSMVVISTTTAIATLVSSIWETLSAVIGTLVSFLRLRYVYYAILEVCAKRVKPTIVVPGSLVTSDRMSLISAVHKGIKFHVTIPPYMTMLMRDNTVGLECAIQGSLMAPDKRVRHTFSLFTPTGMFVGSAFRMRVGLNTYIVTASHVVDSFAENKPYIMKEKCLIPLVGLRQIGRSAEMDFVVFEDTQQVAYFGVSVGKSRAYQSGTVVTTHGTCDGNTWYQSTGRSRTSQAPTFDHWSSTEHGFSGSPLFDGDGYIVGMHLSSELVDGKRVNRAIDMHYVIRLMERVTKVKTLESYEENDNRSPFKYDDVDEGNERMAYAKVEWRENLLETRAETNRIHIQNLSGVEQFGQWGYDREAAINDGLEPEYLAYHKADAWYESSSSSQKESVVLPDETPVSAPSVTGLVECQAQQPLPTPPSPPPHPTVEAVEDETAIEADFRAGLATTVAAKDLAQSRSPTFLPLDSTNPVQLESAVTPSQTQQTGSFATPEPACLPPPPPKPQTLPLPTLVSPRQVVGPGPTAPSEELLSHSSTKGHGTRRPAPRRRPSKGRLPSGRL